jgi:hypothetical protein
MKLTEYTIPAKKRPDNAVACTNLYCHNGVLINTGEFSMIANEDGSTTVRYRPGSECYTCGGSGYVFITPAPKYYPAP